MTLHLCYEAAREVSVGLMGSFSNAFVNYATMGDFIASGRLQSRPFHRGHLRRR